MSTPIRRWWDSQAPDVQEVLCDAIARLGDPSDTELEEIPDCASQIEHITDEALRVRAREAVAAFPGGSPSEGFTRRYGRISSRLAAFLDGEAATVQQRTITDLEYIEGAFLVDFDGSLSQGEGPSTKQRVDIDGQPFVPLATLVPRRGAEPLYGYLVVNPNVEISPIYLAEPSGPPELVAKTLDALVQRLRSIG